MALDSGSVIEDFVMRLREALKLPEGKAPISERQAAKLLIAADCMIEAGDFLPSPEKAEKENDREALNMLARHYLAFYARDKKTVQLERAWQVTQAALAAGKVDAAQKDEAIRRAVELTPKIRESLGRAWLEESFTSRPERGMEIIAAIGAASAQGLQTRAFDVDFRLKSLGLQKLAVEALMNKRPSSRRSGPALSPCWPKRGFAKLSSRITTTIPPASARGCITTLTAIPTIPITTRSRPK